VKLLIDNMFAKFDGQSSQKSPENEVCLYYFPTGFSIRGRVFYPISPEGQ